MAGGFKLKGNHYVAKLDELERGVVAGLMEQTRDLLAPPERASTGDPLEDLVAGLGVSLAAEDQTPDTPDGPDHRDPALDRLLPTAHRGDDQIAAEFRRLTEHDMRDRKATNLEVAAAALRRATGDRVELTRAEAEATVIALTDTRLLLGERLGLRTDEDAMHLQERLAGLDDDDPAVYAVSFYDFLTWLQESLTGALMGRGRFR